MAKRKYKNKSIVSGLTIDTILNMDIKTFNRLDKSDLQKIVGRLVSAGNKRIRALEKANIETPATKYVKDTGGKFSTRGKSLNQLRSEYIRAKNFINAKTSSVSGWKKVKRETVKGLKGSGVNVNANNLDSVLMAYEKLKSIDPSVGERQLKYKVMGRIVDEIDHKTPEQIALELSGRINEIYESSIEEDDTGLSDFFEI